MTASAAPARHMIVVHSSGAAAVIARRKDDETGWWLTDGSGIADSALDSPHWVVVDPAELWAERTRLTTEETTS